MEFELVDTYLGATGVVTGSARVAKEAEDRSTADALEEEIARKGAERERRWPNAKQWPRVRHSCLMARQQNSQTKSGADDS